jgi:geranylgeranyl reductase family protein
MKPVLHDVIVVGAGPAGLIAAREASGQGSQVAIFEEHEVVGLPDHCAGILSVTGLRTLGLSPSTDVIQNHVGGARIHSPAGETIEIQRGHREALIVDRRRFDAWLAERAVSRGAELTTGLRVREMTPNPSGEIEVRMADDTRRTSKVVIDAEGAGCLIARSAGFPAVKRDVKRPAFQYELRGVDIEDDVVEMFYGRRLAPGFFAWMVPLGDGRARIGLAATDRAKIRLDAAMKHHPVISERVRKSRIERSIGGTVLVGLPLGKTYKRGMMIVGDAAGMTKPTTGGGVVVGGIAARIAGTVAAEAVSETDASASYLRRYQRLWRSALMGDLRAMYLAQRFLSSLSDRGLDSLVHEANERGLVDVVKESGDMDRQKQVIHGLLRKPSTILVGLRAVRYMCLF